MDIPKLERMVAIYDAGSFRKAAKLLGMSQPALTWSMQQLEESLNARLFERGPRGIQPTALCERLVTRTRLVLREQERMLADVQESGRTLTINLGVHSIFLTDAFARCVAAFADTWPTVTLRIREGFSTDLIERLRRGELDFACCALPDENDGDALILEPLAMLNYSIVARPDHAVFDDIARGGPIGTYPWVEFDTAILGSFPGNIDINAILETMGLGVGQRSVRTVSMELIRRLTATGGFIGLIADKAIAQELAEGTLRRLPGAGINPSQFGFTSLKDDLETNAIKHLKQLFRETAFVPLGTGAED